MSLDVRSGAFALEDIPVEYTGDGRNISPPLEWTPGPRGTKSYALIMDDPDSSRGTWVHWVLWNIRDPGLPAQVACQPQVDTAFGRLSQGRNSYGRIGYSGPCQPAGTHRYFFKLYALDTELDLAPETTKRDLVAAMATHILDHGEMMVTHSRARALAARLASPEERVAKRPIQR